MSSQVNLVFRSDVVKTHLVFDPISWHKSPKPLESLKQTVSFSGRVQRFGKWMSWLGGWQPLDSFRMGAGHPKDQGRIKVFIPAPNLWGGETDWRLNWSQVTQWLDKLHQGSELPLKPRRTGFRELLDSRTRWCSWRRHASSLRLLPVHLFICVLHNVHSNKEIKLFPRVLGTPLANWTQEGGCGNLHLYPVD
jgi:hypothetical protein